MRLNTTASTPAASSEPGHDLGFEQIDSSPSGRPEAGRSACPRAPVPDPGAVPLGFGSNTAPSGYSACRRFEAGISRPQRSESLLERLGVGIGELHLEAERSAHRLSGQVVLGGPDARR